MEKMTNRKLIIAVVISLIVGVIIGGSIIHFIAEKPKAEITTSLQVTLTGGQLIITNTGDTPITYTFTVQILGFGLITRSITIESGQGITIPIVP